MADNKLVRKKVVVIGNGASGSNVTAKLAKDKSLDVTVITPYNFIEIPVTMTTIVASASAAAHEKNIYDLVREDGVNYVIDKATTLSNNTVTVKSGDSIPFDIAIVATGVAIPIFQMNPDVSDVELRKAEIRNIHQQINAANTIVISGGGAIGSELAADIKLRYPSKRVVLVTTDDKILTRMHPTLSDIATKQIQTMNVELITKDKVLSFNDGEATLQTGKKIIADLYIPCHASKVNSSFMPAHTLDDKGFIKVDDNLEVVGLPNVFAVADVSNRDSNKAFIKVDDQVPAIVHNIQAKANGKPLKPHVPGMMGKIKGPVMVALGHERPDGFGLGPDLPGCMGYCIWCCCCGAPAGKSVAKMKSDFNNSIKPKKGVGMSK